ncbi:MAG: DUF1844 domain-containing protein [Polyangiales bacterium]
MSQDEDSPAEHDADEAAYEAAASALPPIDFTILVLSLNTSALVHLGEKADPSGRSRLDLPMARHTIDMLGILEEKTRGNLTGEEERILHQVLLDLRLRFTGKAG